MVVLNFDANGYQTSSVSADGFETLSFTYDGSHNLTGMTAIDGASTTFNYTSGKVSSISTYGSRSWTLAPTIGASAGSP